MKNTIKNFVKKFKNLPLLAWCVRTDKEYNRVKKYADNVIFENITPIV